MEPHRLQTFVRNRVVDVQTQSSADAWKHVSSSDNPADLLSRGIAPKSLVDSRLWWHGPIWLAEAEEQWPVQYSCQSTGIKETAYSANVTANKDNDLLSSIYKHTRVQVAAKGTTQRRGNSAIINNTDKASTESFPEEVQALRVGKAINPRSSILGINPFLHNDNTLRVGGRLEHSEFEFDKKHPVILSSKHHLTKLIFKDAHRRLLHAGPQALLTHIREKYWPIARRNLARQVTHQCTTCFCHKPKGISPQMAELPRERVCPAPIFYNVGTDYVGPFLVKDRKGSGSTNSELNRLGEFLRTNEGKLQDRLMSERINWSFIPPISEEMGGWCKGY
ncbi:PREDICTED: uncharacterized protein LOC105460828 [Wasmannia auropunctata]|uniref:uncharacterized protein LOC105460828 n=1 Tax=Wasmannia auropunctata TaxID=64793 RepID=UPI0005EEF8B5|nr:PREDICTED: uncharacterized protein LOC105460828 [Wasmannia auropunctata]